MAAFLDKSGRNKPPLDEAVVTGLRAEVLAVAKRATRCRLTNLRKHLKLMMFANPRVSGRVET